MFCSKRFNCFIFYIMIKQWIIIWSIRTVIFIIIYYVCALQGISFIVFSAWTIIVGNSEVRSVVCFEWIHVFYYSNHSIFLMHSNSYFITHKYYPLFYFITFLVQSLLWRGEYEKTGRAIKRKISKSKALKYLLYLGVIDHSEGNNSTFLLSFLW